MTEQDFLFLARRVRAEKITREVCAEIREALNPQRVTEQAEPVEVPNIQPIRARKTKAKSGYADPAPRKNEGAPDGKEELLTVCLDGTKIYKYWKNGTAHYRTSGGNEK